MKMAETVRRISACRPRSGTDRRLWVRRIGYGTCPVEMSRSSGYRRCAIQSSVTVVSACSLDLARIPHHLFNPKVFNTIDCHPFVADKIT